MSLPQNTKSKNVHNKQTLPLAMQDAIATFEPPSQIVFSPQGTLLKAEVFIRASLAPAYAPSDEGIIAFKVKTNRAERYAVKPHTGMLEAGEVRAISCALVFA